MNRQVLILQHVPWESPGLIARALNDAGVEWSIETIVASRHSMGLPTMDQLAGIVILGGPMGALDIYANPGLAIEAQLVKDAVAADIPLLGVCLGHQIIAAALGAALRTSAAKEIGVGDITVVTDDPVFGEAGSTHPVLHWHHDVVDAPSEATIIASTEQTPNQAFRLGEFVLATQFHLEVDRQLLSDWLAVDEMTESLGEVATTIQHEFTAVEAQISSLADRAFGSYAQLALARL